MENKININKASAKEIAQIETVTTETANAIVEYRDRREGSIESLDELSGLNGIDGFMLEKIRDNATLT